MVAAFVAIILIGVPVNAAGAITHSQSASTSRSFSAIYSTSLEPKRVKSLNDRLMYDFIIWTVENNVTLNYSSETNTSLLWEFLNDSPKDAQLMNKITSDEEQNDSQYVPTNTSIDNLVIEEGTPTFIKSSTYYNNGTSCNVSIYNYSLIIHQKEYIVTAAILNSTYGKELVDPLVSVQIDYLWIWFFGEHKYREVDYLYQDYYYDTYAFNGQHVNEALAYEALWNGWTTTITASAFLYSIFSLPAAAVMGSLTYFGFAFDLAWDAADFWNAKLVMDAAYSDDQEYGLEFVPTNVQNDYIYDSYAGVVLGNGWGVNVWDAATNNGVGGWVTALYPTALSGIDSPDISNLAHTWQNEFGTEQIWVGTLWPVG